MVNCNCDKKANCRPKIYCFAVKEVFVMLAVFFSSDNATLFTFCKQKENA